MKNCAGRWSARPEAQATSIAGKSCCHAEVLVLYPPWSIDTSRIRDILKEEIGKLPAEVEPVGESRGGQELPG